ncbi:zinc finger, CCHC-type containing protein [Tanacetum coccineum]
MNFFLVSKFKNLNIEIPENFIVGAIITKLPSSWHNYRKKPMHTSEDFTLDQIQKHLRIEEETCIREKNLNGASSSKVNYVDSGKNNKENDKKRKGWIHQRTTSYTPQQNGVAERKNRVLQDMSNAMLVNANLPKNLWGKSLLIACHRNRAESSSAHRRSEMARKERNLDLDFIDFQAIIFLVEGDNQNNVINKIPVTLPKGKRNIIMDQSAGLKMFGSDTIKLDRMDGMNFTRWKEKIKFLLTTFKVYYVLEGQPIGVMTEEEQRKREQD